MTRVLNGPVFLGDVIAYSIRKYWGMSTRIGVVASTVPNKSILVRVIQSSDGRELSRLVRITELSRVVKIKGRTL